MSILTTGLEDLQMDLGSLIEMPDGTMKEMLEAGGGVLAKGQKATAISMGVYDRSQKYPSKHVKDTITVGSRMKRSGDTASINVYPSGSRKRGKTSTNQGTIAFVNEYGKTGQKARPFITKANAQYENQAVKAAEKVYDEYLNKKGL